MKNEQKWDTLSSEVYMPDNTNEHEVTAFFGKYSLDAAGWEEQPIEQFPFSYTEPETLDKKNRILRWFDFMDR
jgi:hypothetical protein